MAWSSPFAQMQREVLTKLHYKLRLQIATGERVHNNSNNPRPTQPFIPPG